MRLFSYKIQEWIPSSEGSPTKLGKGLIMVNNDDKEEAEIVAFIKKKRNLVDRERIQYHVELEEALQM